MAGQWFSLELSKMLMNWRSIPAFLKMLKYYMEILYKSRGKSHWRSGAGFRPAFSLQYSKMVVHIFIHIYFNVGHTIYTHALCMFFHVQWKLGHSSLLCAMHAAFLTAAHVSCIPNTLHLRVGLRLSRESAGQISRYVLKLTECYLQSLWFLLVGSSLAIWMPIDLHENSSTFNSDFCIVIFFVLFYLIIFLS